MKLGTIQKLNDLRAAGYNSDLLNDMQHQGEAAEELALKCDLHPMFHAFSALFRDKQELLTLTGQVRELAADIAAQGVTCTIYGGDNKGDYLLDSVFDEIIDGIVGALEENCFKAKNT